MSEQNPYGAPQGDTPQGGMPLGKPGEGPGYTWGPGAAGYGYPQGQQPPYGYPQGPPSYGYPQDAVPAYAQSGGAPLVAVGDIVVTQEGIITPVGTLPLKGAVWNATDMSRTEEKMAQTGIVLGIIFGVLLCGLGLLFLLMKEKKTTGFIQVTVTSAGRHHSTMIPATVPESFQMVMGQVNYARSLSI